MCFGYIFAVWEIFAVFGGVFLSMLKTTKYIIKFF